MVFLSENEKYINPFTDYGFKRLFGEEGIEIGREEGRKVEKRELANKMKLKHIAVALT